MECLTAVGLAANILQFIEFGSRLLSEANDAYHSASGLSKENVELQEIAESITRLSERLEAPNLHSQGNGSSATQGSVAEINKIATASKVVAADLIAVIQKLRVEDGSKRGWRSFRQALSSLWQKDKIENLQKRLEVLRNQLSVQLSAYVSTLQLSLVSGFKELKTQFDDLKSVQRDSVISILASLQDIKADHFDLQAETLGRLDMVLKEAQQRLQDYNREREVLGSLSFDTMRHRYHSIREAHQRTFRWIFDSSGLRSSDPRSHIRFDEWLRTGDGVYWLSGKPGSGKSTLMKFICDSEQTNNSLQQWSQNMRLATASFYFWSAGTDMQRTQRGLFQQLLFEILRMCPELIPVVCPIRWNEAPQDDWSLQDLREVFGKLSGTHCQTRFCFFIDGLDEYDGDDIDLIHVIQNIAQTPNMKLCVSSRPLPAFEIAFGGRKEAKLCLQDLTVDDIACFARDELNGTPGFEVLRQEHEAYSDLLSDITRKAQGVFLWVFLVVKSLRQGLTNGDSLASLRRRLEATPSDLEPLFEELITSVDPHYRKDLAVTLEIALHAPEPLCMLTYWFLDEDNYHATISPSLPETMDIKAIEDRMSLRLSGCYKGLLEGKGVPGSRKVRFIHRTVRDYLRTKGIPALLEHQEPLAYAKAAKAFLAHAKFCSNGSGAEMRGFNAQDVENFLIFASWAAYDDNLDWETVEEMNQLFSTRDPMRFLCHAVRFGLTDYLRDRFTKDPLLLHREETLLMRLALSTQIPKVHGVFGLQSSYDTLTFLLREGASPNLKTVNGTLFLEFLSNGGAHARRSKESWAYEQWERSLWILLQHGANVEDPFNEYSFVSSLPQIGSGEGIDDISTVIYTESDTIQKNLNRHVKIYEYFFQHGLNPNLRITSMSSYTLWEMWLLYIATWQTDHGCLEDVCIRVIELFLMNGANPFQTVRFQSDRISGSPHWNVQDMIESFFTVEARNQLSLVFAHASTRWHQTRGLVETIPDIRSEQNRLYQNWLRARDPHNGAVGFPSVGYGRAQHSL